MKNGKLLIAIVNSSSFGISFPEHLRALSAFAELIRVEMPKGAPPAEFHARLAGVDGIVASVTPPYTRDVLVGLPELKLLARHGVGCDNVDIPTCNELGIVVSRVGPQVEPESVAQMTLGLINAAARQIVAGYAMVKAGQWARRATIPLGVDLCGATVGLVGIGAIGRTVARILTLGYRANVVAYDPYVDAGEVAARHARKVDFGELLAKSAVISLHCPLTHETLRMFGGPELAAMNDGVILVNTCRGEIFDQAALIEALIAGKVGGYSTDVVEGEPIGADHVLLATPRVIVTPHLGGYSVVSLRGMGQTMVDDMRRVFVEGTYPEFIANPDVDLGTSRIARMRAAAR